jgi:hypothetical protein
MRQLEATLVASHTGQGMSVEDLLELNCKLCHLCYLTPGHDPVLAVLGRHTSSLIKRSNGTSLPPGDDLAHHLKPEIDISVNILQGLCILSRSCKAAAGQRWAMEVGRFTASDTS